jgi:dolichol-phosphate mannosyltransferase
MKLSVLIPAYNESENIGATIGEILDQIGMLSDVSDYQIVVVDDRSNDVTYETVERLEDSRIKCLRLSRRSGSHTALRAGISEADGDAVLCISADGQDDPACIGEMVRKWRGGAKVVWALRKDRHEEPLMYRTFTRIFYWILKKLNDVKDNSVDLSRADFYLLDRAVADSIKACDERNTSLFGLIVWLGFTGDFVEYERRKRRHGESKWNFRSRFRLAKDWIIAFSGLPLKMTTFFGMLVAFTGFLYALFIIGNAMFGNPIVGWSSIMVVILILGGVQLTALGIIGEYLWRNIDESKKRPLFFIEKRTDK